MTAKLKERRARLMPHGIPRWIRCYDNGGVEAPRGSSDRYTVCFTGRAATERSPGSSAWYPYRDMSAAPFHPQGIGLYCSSEHQPVDTLGKKPGWHWPPALGRKNHLGTRIRFQDLPEDCRTLVKRDYEEIWRLL